jgi:hypothetical protein
MRYIQWFCKGNLQRTQMPAYHVDMEVQWVLSIC